MTDLELRIIQCLDKKREGISSREIAKECGVSVNTIRKTIHGLEPVLEENGIRIESKTSLGYWMNYTNPGKAEGFLQQVRNKIDNPNFGKHTGTDYKVNYIIRRLLVSRKRVPLEILCEELYYSLSSVRRDLKKIEDILEDYNLSLDLKRGEGYTIEGSEWDKRLCLLGQHKVFVNLEDSYQLLEPNFLAIFGIGNGEIRSLRHQVRDAILRSKRFAYKMYHLPVLTNYIALIQHRKMGVSNVELTKEQELLLQKSGAVEEAKRIFSELKYPLQMSNVEIKTFAMLLLAYRNVTSLKDLQKKEFDSLEQEGEAALDFLERRMELRPYFTEALKEEYLCCIYGIRNRVVFHVHPDSEEAKEFRSRDLIAEDLALYFVDYWKEKMHRHVSLKQMTSVYYVFLKLLGQRASTLYQYKSVLVSSYGYEYASYCAELIQKNYGFYLKEVKPMEYTEVYEYPAKDEIIIHNLKWDMLKLVKEESFSQSIYMRTPDFVEGRVKELESWIVSMRQRWEEAYFHESSLEAKNMEDVLQEILAPMKKQMTAEEYQRMEHTCKCRIQDKTFQLLPEDVVLTALVPEELQGIYVYDLEKEILWENRKKKKVICCFYHAKDSVFQYEAMELIRRILFVK